MRTVPGEGGRLLVVAGRADGQPRVDAAVAALRRRGQRVTPARRAVVQALVALPGHPTAEQVVAEVEAADPTVHRATVYRVLDTLTTVGIVSHLHVSHGATTYHLGEPSHLHAHCGSCGAVLDLPEDLLDPVRTRLLVEHGFALDASHIALSGRCASCRTVGPPTG